MPDWWPPPFLLSLKDKKDRSPKPLFLYILLHKVFIDIKRQLDPSSILSYETTAKQIAFFPMRIEYFLYVCQLQKRLHGRYGRERIPKLAIVLFYSPPPPVCLAPAPKNKSIFFKFSRNSRTFPSIYDTPYPLSKSPTGQTIYGSAKAEKKKAPRLQAWYPFVC